MAKKQSSFIASDGEVNGYGKVTRIKATQRDHHAPYSQNNVKLERDFSMASLAALGSYPVVNDPKNMDPITLQFLGSMAVLNMVFISKNEKTGKYEYKIKVAQQNITSGSTLQQASSRRNQSSTADRKNIWVASGFPLGAKWRYLKEGSYVESCWVQHDEAWYYVDADQSF